MFSKAANFDSQDGESLIERKEQSRRLKLVTAAKEVLVGVAIVVVVVIVVIVAVVVVLVVVFVDAVCVLLLLSLLLLSQKCSLRPVKLFSCVK